MDWKHRGPRPARWATATRDDAGERGIRDADADAEDRHRGDEEGEAVRAEKGEEAAENQRGSEDEDTHLAEALHEGPDETPLHENAEDADRDEGPGDLLRREAEARRQEERERRLEVREGGRRQGREEKEGADTGPPEGPNEGRDRQDGDGAGRNAVGARFGEAKEGPEERDGGERRRGEARARLDPIAP